MTTVITHYFLDFAPILNCKQIRIVIFTRFPCFVFALEKLGFLLLLGPNSCPKKSYEFILYTTDPACQTSSSTQSENL